MLALRPWLGGSGTRPETPRCCIQRTQKSGWFIHLKQHSNNILLVPSNQANPTSLRHKKRRHHIHANMMHCSLVSNLILHHSRFITETVQPPYNKPGVLQSNSPWDLKQQTRTGLKPEREKKQPILTNYWQKPKELLTIRKQREGAAVTANKSIVIRGKGLHSYLYRAVAMYVWSLGSFVSGILLSTKLSTTNLMSSTGSQ